mmetsp:Transcript_62810/g.205018  ORF Transcript_62810/g.205018 Transcript_62810/m.205018 type:complete len:255 (+) Transcript_62810:113-877(+)
MEFTFRDWMAPMTRDWTAQMTRDDKLKHFHIAILKVRPLLESSKRWANEAHTAFRELRTCSIHLRNDAFDMPDECQTTIDSFLEKMRQTRIFSQQCEEVSDVVVEGNVRAKLASSCAAELRSDLEEVTRQVQSEAGVMQELDVLVKELQQVVDSQDSEPEQANFGDRISSTCEKLQSFWLKQKRWAQKRQPDWARSDQQCHCSQKVAQEHPFRAQWLPSSRGSSRLSVPMAGGPSEKCSAPRSRTLLGTSLGSP